MFKLNLFILVINILASQAAVIRILDKKTDVVENTTVSIDILTTTLVPGQTTINDQDLISTTTEGLGARSRDEEATILIADQTLFDSAGAELIKTETQTADLSKSGKLLLLSTPKIAEKPKQLEENLEESEEENEVVENVTQIAIETTTMATTDEETTTNLNVDTEIATNKYLNIKDQSDSSTTNKITKLYPINDTLYADSNKMFEYETKEISATTSEDQPQEALNANFRSVVFQEYEPDYVLVESEVLQGSYTDVDSELHLQPIVQSVEIVPSSLDDTLFINYVQSW